MEIISAEQSYKNEVDDMDVNEFSALSGWWSNLKPRHKAIIYIKLRTIFGALYHGIAKEAMNGASVMVMDLCFYRCLINFIVACMTVTVNKKHLFKDLPSEHRKLVLLRCLMATAGFTSIVYAIDNLPLFITTTIFNTTPFWTGVNSLLFPG